MPKLVRCNLCGSDRYSVLYKNSPASLAEISIDSYTITENQPGMPLRVVKCSSCGLIYANPRPAPELLIDNYKKMVDPLYLEEEEGRRLSAQAILKKLRCLGKSGRILEVGCATAFLLDEARKLGWEVFGAEPSKWAVRYAHDQLGIINIFPGTIEQAGYPSGFFDAVLLKDVIEHLCDPKGALVEISRILKPDGILCINTPDVGSLISRILRARWWGVKQAHLYYFTRGSIYKMLQAAGFIPLRTVTHARVFTIKYWLSRIKDYNNMLYGILAFFLRRNIIKNRLIKINFADQIEVYARVKNAE